MPSFDILQEKVKLKVAENKLPKLNFEDNPSVCCPRFDPEPWEGKSFTFEDKLFVKATTFNLFHIPLNMGPVITKTWRKIKDAGARSQDEFVMLSYEPSPWIGEHYFAVSKEVPGAENARLSGKFLAKVFEGPYKEARNWMDQVTEYVKAKGKKLEKLHFYYTTCPKCAKFYGKNYVVAFAQVE